MAYVLWYFATTEAVKKTSNFYKAFYQRNQIIKTPLYLEHTVLTLNDLESLMLHVRQKNWFRPSTNVCNTCKLSPCFIIQITPITFTLFHFKLRIALVKLLDNSKVGKAKNKIYLQYINESHGIVNYFTVFKPKKPDKTSFVIKSRMR